MSLITELETRAENKCELCNSTKGLAAYQVPPSTNGIADTNVLVCSTCNEQIDNPDKVDVHHWRCLNESMWSQVPAVQVMAWRMLNRLKSEAWAQDLLDMLYLDDETLAWAESGAKSAAPEEDSDAAKHLDANGVQLQAGDTITLIKDLNVKGAGFTAKRGTAVRNISLVAGNEKHIEGRISSQQIVILTEFVKKSG